MTISGNYLSSRFAAIMPGVQTITFTPYSTGDTAGSTSTVNGAFREPQRKRTFQDGSVFTPSADECEWLLPAASMTGVTPKAGDTITDSDSVIWTIQTVTSEHIGGLWRCPCFRQRGTA